MNENKILIKILKVEMVNNKPTFECEEVETSKKVLLKKNPKLETTLSIGKKYWAVINQNWINIADPFEAKEEATPKETPNLVAKAEKKYTERYIKSVEDQVKEEEQRLFSVSLSYAKDFTISNGGNWDECKQAHKAIYNYMKEGKLE